MRGVKTQVRKVAFTHWAGGGGARRWELPISTGSVYKEFPAGSLLQLYGGCMQTLQRRAHLVNVSIPHAKELEGGPFLRQPRTGAVAPVNMLNWLQIKISTANFSLLCDDKDAFWLFFFPFRPFNSHSSPDILCVCVFRPENTNCLVLRLRLCLFGQECRSHALGLEGPVTVDSKDNSFCPAQCLGSSRNAHSAVSPAEHPQWWWLFKVKAPACKVRKPLVFFPTTVSQCFARLCSNIIT